MELTDKIRLELTLAQVHQTLSWLGKHPFEDVAGLIHDIDRQAAQQIQAAQPAMATPGALGAHGNSLDLRLPSTD